MKEKIVNSLVYIAFLLVICSPVLKRCSNEKKSIEIRTPEIEGSFVSDTLVPVITYRPETVLVKTFIASDSISKIDIYKEAVSEREYVEVFKDSNQVITVNAKVEGVMKDLTVNYTILPKVIKVPENRSIELYVGAEVNPLDPFNSIEAKASLVIDKSMYSYGYNFTSKTHTVGYSFNLFNNKKR